MLIENMNYNLNVITNIINNGWQKKDKFENRLLRGRVNVKKYIF